MQNLASPHWHPSLLTLVLAAYNTRQLTSLEASVTSSHISQLQKASQAAIITMTSLRKPYQFDLSKPSITKNDQQSKEARSRPTFLTVHGSNLTCTDSDAHTKNMEIEHIVTKGTSSSNVCRSSNCLPVAAKETRTNCLSKVEEKNREVFLGKSYTGKTEKLPEEVCFTSQITSNSLIEGCGVIGRVQCSYDSESTSLSIQYSTGTITSEIHLPQNLDESKSKKLYDCAPFMNGDLIMHKDSGDKPDRVYVDTSTEKHSFECSDCVSNLRSPCISSSEISVVHTELRKELSGEVDVQNNEEHLQKIISQVQQAIFTKTPTREECFNSSLDAQPILSGGCQPQDDLQLCELRNESCSVDGNVLMADKKITLDNLKQDAFLLKHRLSYVPYSEEWLAAIEAFGEEFPIKYVGGSHARGLLPNGPYTYLFSQEILITASFGLSEPAVACGALERVGTPNLRLNGPQGALLERPSHFARLAHGQALCCAPDASGVFYPITSAVPSPSTPLELSAVLPRPQDFCCASPPASCSE
ncbi:hypothetical protein KSP40_PGU006045 [Platanthera guangdongensis]|uniref:Uncharacterized protein n=1 Tax=Platanthera guangdongensis TaxID=2320717 RepID=A0ABR2MUK6_9ASPA